MINRKSKIRLIQFLLLIVCSLIVFKTYFTKQDEISEKIISPNDLLKINKDLKKDEENDTFYNVQYSGLDLAGNRYVLKSKEAITNKEIQEIVEMKSVNAVFYFKDNTTLFVTSDKGTYNNKSLDMVFEKNIKANYENSELFGEKIVYLNSKKTLIISDNVRISDIRGTMKAQKLLFDLEKKTLDISSDESKINADIILKWKKDLQY